MKLLLLALITASFANAQNVNIPDANFKAYLVGNASINTNMDTEIQVSEANAFTGLISVVNESISDLTGIEAFTALTFLSCGSNQLTSLDVSNNSALTGLACEHNQLTSLDVSNNTALNSLHCYYNQLTCLNAKNGNNVNFIAIYAANNPNLTCIEVDDTAWSTANWTDPSFFWFDAQTSFSTNCNNACSNNVGIEELSSNSKELIKITNMIGQETEYKPNTPLIYIYSDGSTEKVYHVE